MSCPTTTSQSWIEAAELKTFDPDAILMVQGDLSDFAMLPADRHFAATAYERLGAQHQRPNAERCEKRNLGKLDNQSLAALRQFIEARINLLRPLNVKAAVEHDVTDPIVGLYDFHVHARAVPASRVSHGISKSGS